MKKYLVSFPCIWPIEVEEENINTPEEAANWAEADCPVTIDGLAYVVDLDTGETFEEV